MNGASREAESTSKVSQNERNERRPSYLPIDDAIIESFVDTTGSRHAPLTPESFVQAAHSLFMYTLGIQGPGEECARTLFHAIDAKGDDAVNLEEFRSSAPRLLALGAFWYTTKVTHSVALSAREVQFALLKLGLDVKADRLRAIRALNNNSGKLFDWHAFWEMFPHLRGLDVPPADIAKNFRAFMSVSGRTDSSGLFPRAIESVHTCSGTVQNVITHAAQTAGPSNLPPRCSLSVDCSIEAGKHQPEKVGPHPLLKPDHVAGEDEADVGEEEVACVHLPRQLWVSMGLA